MDEGQRLAVTRMPLVEGVLWLFRHALGDDLLEEIWDEHRGRCYDDVLTFPVMVQLIQDALMRFPSGRESFLKHQADGLLETTLQAAYGKLSRIPVAVSQGLLRSCSQRLRKLFPEWSCSEKPGSLEGFHVLIYDGKAMKRVAKRLKPCRGAPGGLLGGRALVAIDWETGLALAMRGDVDGDANDVKHVGELVPQVCDEYDGPRLHVSDRAFCDLKQPQHFTQRAGDRFLVRYHPKVKFHRDETVPARRGVNDLGQPILETWGWLGGPNDKRRRRVRRLELVRREADSVILITDLLDADAYPATELLWTYRQRWDIERLFQQVTEVFGLSHLIGCSPEATLFQFSLCLVLYNVIQAVRGFIAQAQDREPTDISSEMMFRDVTRQLNAWSLLIDHKQTAAHFDDLPDVPVLRRKLQALFARCWESSWQATPHQAVHRQTPRRKTRSHNSVHRLLHGTPKKTPRKTQPRC